ncbi:MAG: threonine/serine dehydratase [Gammaproteobacteria bacterium]
MKLHIQTPLIRADRLSKALGKEIYLKLEALQPPGSFKIRGIGRLAQYFVTQGKTHLVASSGGNAGVAVAYAGMRLGVPVTVFLPTTSHQLFIDALRLYSTDIRVVGEVWDETHQAASQFAAQHDAAYIPPFDHPIIWQGHATIIDELQQDGIKPDAIIAAVGGGGLACGLLHGLTQLQWQDTTLLTAETEGAACFARSVAAGKLVTLSAITSKATSLGAKQCAKQLFENTKQFTIIPNVISDQAAAQACYRFADEQRLLVELASGAALAVAYEQLPSIIAYNTIVIVVCGGLYTSVDILSDYSSC